MHDPSTVAFEIKRPWPARSEIGKDRWWWPSMITIWHVDPETDGSDDSCGWSRVKLSDKGAALAAEMNDWEKAHPYYFTTPTRIKNPEYSYHEILPGDCFALVLGIFGVAAWRLDRRRLTVEDMLRAAQLSVHDSDNLQAMFASSRYDKSEYSAERSRLNAFRCVIQHYENEKRRWWQHPRWHVWHWQLQILPLQSFKRWAFSRCKVCRRGFSWGYSPIADSWNSDGPRWFKSEQDARHHDCSNPGSSGIAQAAAA